METLVFLVTPASRNSPAKAEMRSIPSLLQAHQGFSGTVTLSATNVAAAKEKFQSVVYRELRQFNSDH
jgi:hypothetical protein